MLQGIGAILIFAGQICNCFTVPWPMANCAYLSQLSKIAGEVDLQIFLNKIIVWFDAVTLRIFQSLKSFQVRRLKKLTANFLSLLYHPVSSLFIKI